MKIPFIGMLAAVSLGALVSLNAGAQTLPAATFVEGASNANGTENYSYSPGSVSGSGCAVVETINGVPLSGCEQSSVSTSSALSISASGSSNGPTASAGGTITYSYEVLGPSGLYVPLTITGSGSAAESGQNANISKASISWSYVDPTYGYDTSSFSVQASGAQPTNNVNALNTSFQDKTGFIGQVMLSASIDIQGADPRYATETGSASVDPLLTIDPNFLASHPGVSLILSTNVTPGVPEPSTPALLLLGLGAVVWALRAKNTGQ